MTVVTFVAHTALRRAQARYKHRAFFSMGPPHTFAPCNRGLPFRMPWTWLWFGSTSIVLRPTFLFAHWLLAWTALNGVISPIHRLLTVTCSARAITPYATAWYDMTRVLIVA